ncbi:uncharacterized protein EV422DRAFT_508803 [Fimicolochytrium jonesii]|uniref:uncharacterized protein n=1 Tax=Fimicolochytrium jonesii TaxID=1396493 RepID=UPI0022FDC6F4|nr:uncharacterized protein EV422DRAFT_508803 [Fimicolochytrium jonesii]KAI8817735.1 hypothetical protein EV422DRAFT_508803 [Fimicolochytrium jonesii]
MTVGSAFSPYLDLPRSSTTYCIVVRGAAKEICRDSCPALSKGQYMASFYAAPRYSTLVKIRNRGDRVRDLSSDGLGSGTDWIRPPEAPEAQTPKLCPRRRAVWFHGKGRTRPDRSHQRKPKEEETDPDDHYRRLSDDDRTLRLTAPPSLEEGSGGGDGPVASSSSALPLFEAMVPRSILLAKSGYFQAQFSFDPDLRTFTFDNTRLPVVPSLGSLLEQDEEEEEEDGHDAEDVTLRPLLELYATADYFIVPSVCDAIETGLRDAVQGLSFRRTAGGCVAPPHPSIRKEPAAVPLTKYMRTAEHMGSLLQAVRTCPLASDQVNLVRFVLLWMRTHSIPTDDESSREAIGAALPIERIPPSVLATEVEPTRLVPDAAMIQAYRLAALSTEVAWVAGGCNYAARCEINDGTILGDAFTGGYYGPHDEVITSTTRLIGVTLCHLIPLDEPGIWGWKITVSGKTRTTKVFNEGEILVGVAAAKPPLFPAATAGGADDVGAGVGPTYRRRRYPRLPDVIQYWALSSSGFLRNLQTSSLPTEAPYNIEWGLRDSEYVRVEFDATTRALRFFAEPYRRPDYHECILTPPPAFSNVTSPDPAARLYAMVRCSKGFRVHATHRNATRALRPRNA